VLPVLTPQTLVRVSDTMVIITVPAVAEYDVDAPETITLAVPPESVIGRQVITTPQRIVITPEPGRSLLGGQIFYNNTEPSLQRERLVQPMYQQNATATVRGTLVEVPSEETLRAGGATLVLQLSEDSWAKPTLLSEWRSMRRPYRSSDSRWRDDGVA
jgi:hypothetical protein